MSINKDGVLITSKTKLSEQDVRDQTNRNHGKETLHRVSPPEYKITQKSLMSDGTTIERTVHTHDNRGFSGELLKAFDTLQMTPDGSEIRLEDRHDLTYDRTDMIVATDIQGVMKAIGKLTDATHRLAKASLDGAESLKGFTTANEERLVDPAYEYNIGDQLKSLVENIGGVDVCRSLSGLDSRLKALETGIQGTDPASISIHKLMNGVEWVCTKTASGTRAIPAGRKSYEEYRVTIEGSYDELVDILTEFNHDNDDGITARVIKDDVPGVLVRFEWTR